MCGLLPGMVFKAGLIRILPYEKEGRLFHLHLFQPFKAEHKGSTRTIEQPQITVPQCPQCPQCPPCHVKALHAHDDMWNISHVHLPHAWIVQH